jgi:hypothetical protein
VNLLVIEYTVCKLLIFSCYDVALRMAALGTKMKWVYTTTYKHMLRILKVPGSISSMEARLAGLTTGRLLQQFSGWYVRWKETVMMRDGVFTKVLIKIEVQWVCYNERCYNEEFLSLKSGCYKEQRCYNVRFLILLLWKVRLYSQFSLGKDCLCFSCALDCLCFLLGKVCLQFSIIKIIYAFQIYMHIVQQLNKLPYFSIYNAYLMYNAQSKLFRHFF